MSGFILQIKKEVNDIMSISEEYYEWLCTMVNPKEHYALLSYLHNREFLWDPQTMPMDENRAEDGRGLRGIFTNIAGYHQYENHMTDACSVFEMLIGVARRMDYIMLEIGQEEQTDKWFWVLLENLGLDTYTDKDFYAGEVHDILMKFMQRDIDFNGNGGLFPMIHADENQADVEIWYQMSAYLDEVYTFTDEN